MTKYPTTKYFHEPLEFGSWEKVKGVVEINHPDYKKKYLYLGDYTLKYGREEKFYLSLDKTGGGHVKFGNFFGWPTEEDDDVHWVAHLKKEKFFRRGRKKKSLKLRRLKKVGKYLERVIKNLTT